MGKKNIELDGVEYIRKDSVKNYEEAENVDGLEYKIVRTYSAGVFAGYLESEEGQVVILRNARRLWYWSGAASLSQLAMEGVSKVSDCKFPCEVKRVKLLQVIEILDATKEAKKSIDSVPVWSA